jgi:hypothetical protein
MWDHCNELFLDSSYGNMGGDKVKFFDGHWKRLMIVYYSSGIRIGPFGLFYLHKDSDEEGIE